jgi:hypothetical protein
MIELDYAVVSFWELAPYGLPSVAEIAEFEGGVYFVMSAVIGVVTKQSPTNVADTLERKSLLC